MRQAEAGGAIVNTSSVGALTANPVLPDYGASKAAVNHLTRSAGVAFGPIGIRVNAIAPGWFPSDMSKMILDRFGEDFAERIPLGRLGGPDDLKGAIAFLASQASAYVTGQVLLVDGGQTA